MHFQWTLSTDDPFTLVKLPWCNKHACLDKLPLSAAVYWVSYTRSISPVTTNSRSPMKYSKLLLSTKFEDKHLTSSRLQTVLWNYNYLHSQPDATLGHPQIMIHNKYGIYARSYTGNNVNALAISLFMILHSMGFSHMWTFFSAGASKYPKHIIIIPAY